MIFFFKQKTAYEMRISDWSSDVCSSDLRDHQIAVFADQFLAGHNIVDGGLKTLPHRHRAVSGGQAALAHVFEQVTVPLGNDQPVDNDAVGVQFGCGGPLPPPDGMPQPPPRSEAHTSELQSLMRISYAVFCLKNKHNTYQNDQSYTPAITNS